VLISVEKCTSILIQKYTIFDKKRIVIFTFWGMPQKVKIWSPDNGRGRFHWIG